MGQDGCEVGEGGQDDVGAHESRECRGGANVDAAEDGGEDAAKDNSAERVVLVFVNVGEEMAERSSSVAGQGPKDTAGGNAAADDGYECWHQGEEQQAN